MLLEGPCKQAWHSSTAKRREGEGRDTARRVLPPGGRACGHMGAWRCTQNAHRTQRGGREESSVLMSVVGAGRGWRAGALPHDAVRGGAELEGGESGYHRVA